MQMVGATRGFIAKPINQRAVVNGLIAAGIAIITMWFTVSIIESFIPDFKLLRDNNGLFTLFFVMIILGITISLASTYRSVIKYLKMKLDDLY
jgi:cell division transport system permease protein